MNLDQRLADAARHVAEQVDPPEVDLDAVRSAAYAGRRRTAAVALTGALALAAAVVTAALVGIPLLADQDSTAPRPAAPPTSHIIRTLRDTDCATGRCLRPNTYYAIPLGEDLARHRLRARLAVQSGGWEANAFLHRLSRSSAQGAVVLSVYQPHEFAGTQPCAADGATTKVAPDATVDDVARVLTTLPQFAVLDGPRALPAFGRDTRYLQVRADRIRCPANADSDARYNLAHIYGSDGHEPDFDSDIDPGRPVLIDFWVLELEGKPIVVEARQEGRPEDTMIRGLDQARESLTFGIRQ